MIRKLLCILFLGVVFAACDFFPSNSDGAILVNLSGINQRNFPTLIDGTDIYLKTYETYTNGDLSGFVAGTKIEDIGGTESVSVYVGDPPHVFTYGKTYYLDVWIDIDGDDSLLTGEIYWLTEYLVITINGDIPVWITHEYFSLKP